MARFFELTEKSNSIADFFSMKQEGKKEDVT